MVLEEAIMKVCIPTINQFELLEEAIQLYQNDDAVESIHIIDNSCGLCPRFFKTYDHIKILTPQEPWSVGKSWNWFLANIPGDLIIANDDALPRPNCVTNMAQALADDSEKEIDIFFGCVIGNDSSSDNNYSFFHMRPFLATAIAEFDKLHGLSTDETYGPFNQRYNKAYYEDCHSDYIRRLLGLQAMTVMDALYDHVGSATVKSYGNDREAPLVKAHNRSMEKNARIYAATWGGLPGHEIYTIPFNRKSL